MLGALADARDEHARRERVERAAVSDLHFQSLVAAPVALVLALALAPGALVVEPGLEELRGVEVFLEVAEDIGGGDALWFVDGCFWL